LPVGFFGGKLQSDSEYILCLRSVLMKPEHEAWLDAIFERLDLIL
jgi:tyrosine decarboxylase/aspartate 1-decarboxylase